MQYRQILTLAATFAFAVVPHAATRAQSADPVGVIQRLQGDVSVNSAKAVEGTSIFLRDRLVTGAHARVRINLTDDTQVTFGENAEMVVLQYGFNPFVSEQKGVVVVDVKRGAFLFSTGRSSQIEVKTALADLTASNTEFWAGSTDKNIDGVAVFGGTVEVSNEWGSVVLSARAVTQPRFRSQRSALGALLRSSSDPVGTTVGRGEGPSTAVIWLQEKTDRAMDAITFDSEIARNFK